MIFRTWDAGVVLWADGARPEDAPQNEMDSVLNRLRDLIRVLNNNFYTAAMLHTSTLFSKLLCLFLWPMVRIFLQLAVKLYKETIAGPIEIEREICKKTSTCQDARTIICLCCRLYQFHGPDTIIEISVANFKTIKFTTIKFHIEVP